MSYECTLNFLSLGQEYNLTSVNKVLFDETKARKVARVLEGKISAQPHTKLCIQF